MPEARGTGAWWKWSITVMVIGAAGLVTLGFWSGGSEPVPLNTVSVDRGQLQQTVSATGQLNPVVNVTVGSQVSGMSDRRGCDTRVAIRLCGRAR